MGRSDQPHRDPILLALVFVGGCCGTAARSLLETAHPAGPGAWPWATFAINLTGAFALGLLLQSLARLAPDHGRARLVRLGAGTGFLGGYTTYSTFAVEVTALAWDRSPGGLALAAAYALGSVMLGIAAAGTGVALARRAQGGRP